MKKSKSVFLCGNCGREESRWLGRCPECGEWNSFTETVAQSTAPSGSGSSKRVGSANAKSGSKPQLLKSISTQDAEPFSCGIRELDRVLGGGVVPGGTALVGGEPGIGKSTLMLQMLQQVGEHTSVLYFSGEESLGQIKQRAQRLGVDAKKLYLQCETEVSAIIRTLDKIEPQIVVVDSIQTLVSHEIGAVPGTVNQLKYCSMELVDWAKRKDAALFLVGHVTKDGVIAGPKVVEHMVDGVFYFEQASTGMRIIRATKNRYGSVDEIGLFTMEPSGLQEVVDPRSIFLESRSGAVPPGVAVAAVYEGSRTLIVEIQALTVPAKGGISRIYSDKVDAARVSRVAAILEKHVGISFADQDLYVNVAGGMKLKEVGLDLPLALALYSARVGVPVHYKVVSAGELTLAGEVRHTPHMAKRFRTAGELGFTHCMGPSIKELSTTKGYQPVSTIDQGIGILFKRG